MRTPCSVRIALLLSVLIAGATWALPRPASAQADRVAQYLRDLSSEDASLRRNAVRQLAQIAAWELVEPLMPLLADPDESVRSETRDALEQIGEDAVVALLAGLGADDATMRAGCADVIGRLNYLDDERFQRGLLPLVKDESADVRREACAALGRVGDIAASGTLKEALADPEPQVQTAAATALAKLGDGSGFQVLLKGTVSADPTLRGQVIEPLSLIATPAAFQAIRDLTADADRDVRGAAYYALLGSGAPEAIQAALEGLKDPAWQVRSHLAHIAGVLQVSAAADALLDLLTHDSSPTVRACAAMALANLKDQRAVPALLELLTSKSEMERSGGASALGLLRVKEAAKPLTDLLEDESPEVRRAARLALLQILEECPDCPK